METGTAHPTSEWFSRYLTPPFLQLLLLQKMLLRWYRQLKTSPVDQETPTAESVATARNIHSFSHLLPLCPWKRVCARACVCVFKHTHIKQFYIHCPTSVYPIYSNLELNHRLFEHCRLKHYHLIFLSPASLYELLSWNNLLQRILGKSWHLDNFIQEKTRK